MVDRCQESPRKVTEAWRSPYISPCNTGRRRWGQALETKERSSWLVLLIDRRLCNCLIEELRKSLSRLINVFRTTWNSCLWKQLLEVEREEETSIMPFGIFIEESVLKESNFSSQICWESSSHNNVRAQNPNHHRFVYAHQIYINTKELVTKRKHSKRTIRLTMKRRGNIIQQGSHQGEWVLGASRTGPPKVWHITSTEFISVVRALMRPLTTASTSCGRLFIPKACVLKTLAYIWCWTISLIIQATFWHPIEEVPIQEGLSVLEGIEQG